MKQLSATLCLLAVLTISTFAQDDTGSKKATPFWTEEDRAYLLSNLTRSLEELTQEVEGLNQEQWNFQENPDRWSINQIVEHLAIWELIVMHEISVALQLGEFPQIQKYPPDSLFLGSPNNEITTDFTKPFSYPNPLGNNKGENNLTWITTMRNDSIEFVQREERNLRQYYVNFGPNVHQKCMQIFNHTDRHLNQIKAIKTHPDYPES